MMKVLFDTNVILDAITRRGDSHDAAQQLIRYVTMGAFTGIITAKQVTDLHYILRKYVRNEQDSREILETVLNTFEVMPTMKSDLSIALNSKISDYEDAVLEEVAKVHKISYIVTANIKDFGFARVSVLPPEALLRLIIAVNP